ncbi:MAG TPA: hypothetical protein VGN80_08825 [Devosiaceae bacterium]|jgi:hypothetical protein|nr:hypothetical protein [Devosiaceae bacterium]
MQRLPILLLAVLPLLSACGGDSAQPGDDVAGRQQDLLTPRSDRGVDVQRQPGAERQAPVLAGSDTDDGEVDAIVVSEIPERDRAEVAPADIFGSWAAERAECELATGQRIIVSDTRFADAAGTCEINELVDSGDGFTASMSCDRGGGTEAELLKFTPDGDTMTLTWVARDEPETTLVRCD